MSGIVTNALVEEENFPPGINKLIEYFSRPWPKRLIAYTFNVTAELHDDTRWMDRCIHNVTKSEDKNTPPILNIDWQRSFKRERVLDDKSLKADIAAARQAALSYFEALAEGSMFDEDVINGQNGA